MTPFEAFLSRSPAQYYMLPGTVPENETVILNDLLQKDITINHLLNSRQEKNAEKMNRYKKGEFTLLGVGDQVQVLMMDPKVQKRVSKQRKLKPLYHTQLATVIQVTHNNR